MADLWPLTASQVQEGINAGKFSLEDYVRALLARIETNRAIKAWEYLDPDYVINQAKRLDALLPTERGLLHGVVIGVKDVILTKDMPTCFNSPIYQGRGPTTVDAAPIITLRAAGALFLGKTTTTEFAGSYDGSRSDTKNPHNLECTPGGSSSGSGAAVGDYQVPIALGTQTVGSTIRPGSFNGVYAFKPTWGSISQEGLSQYSVSNDTLGFFSRSVQDLRLLTTAFQFTTDQSLPIGPLSLEKARIAFCKTPGWSLVGPGTRSAWEAGQALLSRAGATVSDLQLPAEFAKVKEWHLTILASEARAAFLGNYRLAKEKMDPSLVALVEQIPDRRRQLAAYDGIARLRPLWDTLSEKYDAIVVPSAVDEAPKGLGNTGDPFVCAMWTMLGVPVINIPGFAGENGLPIGLSLVSSRYNDLYLLQVAEAVGSLWEGAGNFRSQLFEGT